MVKPVVIPRILKTADELADRFLEGVSIEERQNILRSIKQSFVERDYMSIFQTPSTPHHLPIYFAYYTPSRALAYRSIFSQISDGMLVDYLTGRLEVRNRELTRRRLLRRGESTDSNHGAPLLDIKTAITCIGAGPGAEILAMLDILDEELRKEKYPVLAGQERDVLFSEFDERLSGVHAQQIDLRVIDIGSFQFLYDALQPRTNSPIHLSFEQESILTLNNDKLRLMAETSGLITFMFTLNELFSISKSQTCAMLSNFINNMRRGGMLLVIESAGSFSELKVGSKEAMVFRVLDAVKCLDCVSKSDSAWYRIPDTIRHIRSSSLFELNDMRYFVRLYRKK